MRIFFGGFGLPFSECWGKTEVLVEPSVTGLEALIEDGPDGVAVLHDDRYLYANSAWKRQLRHDGADFEGRSIDEDLDPSDADNVKLRMSTQSSGDSAEYRFLRSDQTHILVQLRVVDGLQFQGKNARAFICRDITERRKLQARLLLADRMMSIGALATGVAHEINNPLSYVLGNLGYLNEILLDWKGGDPLLKDEEVIEAVQEAKAGAERVQRIVRDLQAFSRGDQQTVVAIDVGRTLEAALNMAWTEIRFRARLRKQLQEVPPVLANEARLGQVFLNLLLNAAHALPEGKAEQHTIQVGVRAEGLWVIVEVQDTGPGIPQDLLPMVFDPFFTTKPVGVGTGLGLSIAHSIVTDMGGSITVESKPGAGTTFRISLPVADDASGDITGDLEMQIERASARILVIDDEPLIANALKRALNKHTVVIELSGRSAIDRLGTGESFDLVFSDLFMPDMTGIDVYRWAETNRPELLSTFVFMTGGLFSVRMDEFLADVPNDRIEKPFELEKIRAYVQRRLQVNR